MLLGRRSTDARRRERCYGRQHALGALRRHPIAYLFSWLTDILIPKNFSWDALNEKKNQHRFKAGARVPNLERSKGDNRGSVSTHLSSGEMLTFALASPQIMEELVSTCKHPPLLHVKDEPPWQCWLAHVAHLRFANRHAYDLARDVPECDRLQHDFLLAFGKVPKWVDYGKPKFHLPDHFGEVRDSLRARAPRTRSVHAHLITSARTQSRPSLPS